MVKSNMNAMRMLPLIFFLAQAPRRRLAGPPAGVSRVTLSSSATCEGPTRAHARSDKKRWTRGFSLERR
jgi:hypothetical protein